MNTQRSVSRISMLALLLSMFCSPVASGALVTWSFEGLIDQAFGDRISIGDPFEVDITFDTSASLIGADAGDRFDPGARHRYDPSSIVFDINVGGGDLVTSLVPGGGLDALWLRDNSGDATLFGEAAVVDGISFSVRDADFAHSAQLVFRGTTLDIFTGASLPTEPDPRLQDLEVSTFSFSQDGTSGGGPIVLAIDPIEPPTSVPEPSSLPLLSLAAVALLLRRRRCAA